MGHLSMAASPYRQWPRRHVFKILDGHKNTLVFAAGFLIALLVLKLDRTYDASKDQKGSIPSHATSTLLAMPSDEQACRVQLGSRCSAGRPDVANRFTNIYKSADWGTSPSSHTRSGSGSTITGAFETITKLEPKFRELNITAIADVPSGDCGWQFALSTINAADAYFGGDITPHVAQENAQIFHNHLNKVFAFWDLVECPIPQWYTTCDSTPRPFDIVIVRDVIQHMRLNNAARAIKLIVEESGASYIAVTSFSTERCTDQCLTALQSDGGFYHNNLHCPPWNFPEPFYSFPSHDNFPEEADHMELYRVDDLKTVVANWQEPPCAVASK